MSVEIRSPSEDELLKAMKAVEAAFGEEQKEEDLDRHQKAMPRDSRPGARQWVSMRLLCFGTCHHISQGGASA